MSDDFREPQFSLDFESGEDAPAKAHEPTVYSVSDINSMIRQMLEGEFQQIWLRGEISNFKPHTSGHYYFTLKDDGAQISAVMFKGLNQKLKFKPENGLEVLIRGKITVYEPRGNYQIFCETMEPVGAGALQKAFDQLKEKLQAEGLFDPKRKRPIPAFPKHIGLVTSPTGAAIRDILNVLRRRHKGARITLAPAVVQGASAADSIVAAIQMINKVQDIDVLIIGRGGGSIEDMWCFNEEKVARAIAASRIPTISAVGHEIDFTIADFVADLRAPTPSAAAELVVKNAGELAERIHKLKLSLWHYFKHSMQIRTERVHQMSKRLVDPQRRLQDLQIRADELMLRLEGAVFRFLEERRTSVHLALRKMGTPREIVVRLQKRQQMAELRLKASFQKVWERKTLSLKEQAARLDAMSPLRVVQRGYSIVQKAVGKVKSIVTDVSQVKAGDTLYVQLSTGQIETEVKKISNTEKAGGPNGL